MPRNKIIPQMFDVRPVNKSGDLDWEKINKISSHFSERKRNIPERVLENRLPKAAPRITAKRKAEVYVLGQKFESDSVPFFREASLDQSLFIPKTELPKKVPEKKKEFSEKKIPREKRAYGAALKKKIFLLIRIPIIFLKKGGELIRWIFVSPFLLIKFLIRTLKGILKYFEKAVGSFFSVVRNLLDKLQNGLEFLASSPKQFSFGLARKMTPFSLAVLSVFLIIGTTAFWNKGSLIQQKVLGVSQDGYDQVNSALSELKAQNFESSIAKLSEAHLKFSEASDEISKLGSLLIETSKYIPFASQLSSGSNALEAAKSLSLAGEELVKVTQAIAQIKEMGDRENFSLLDLFRDTESHLRLAVTNLKKADEYISQVDVSDLPEEKRAKFVALKTNLPSAILTVDTFLNNEMVLSDLLGGNGPRKYLFLFQNNQEMRATGGFIGSYGLLDITNGRIRNFFIDGIFNPDGQLKEKIIPPKPIQKISAAWSLHDSNWFPDFPASAKEAIVFYEKTGGPTADGVITLTPTVLQKLLEITGPIEMEEYDVTLDSQNFIEKTQYEVEVDYDKEENKPKKILSDLAPLILDKLFSARDLKTIIRTLDVFVEALNQKQILIFSQNAEMEKLISEQGWSGEILQAPKDYLSVINSNINGFKTDGVIEEKIEHEAEIQNDGTVIDTVTITRHHNGGNTGYVWWDKVNADYLRVYVPLGSKFLSVEGQTREFNESPLDYEALGFRKNPRVEKEEAGMTIDDESGTRIYEDSGKTVFANWTYVSPKESMTIKYRYQLPFKVIFDDLENPAQSYSLLAQKQSGSLGSEFDSRIIFPHKFNVVWSSPESLQSEENALQFGAVLNRDLFWGAAFTQKNLIINQ